MSSDNLTVHSVGLEGGSSSSGSSYKKSEGKSLHQALSDNSTFYNYLRKKQQVPDIAQHDTGAGKI